jgi:hypothetical protein
MFEFYNKINDPSLNGAIFIAVCRGKVGCSYKARNRGDLVIHIIELFIVMNHSLNCTLQ